MSEPAPASASGPPGPSGQGGQGQPSTSNPASSNLPSNDANLLRQFVMSYLQQHGFDRAVDTLKAIEGAVNDAEGEDEPMPAAGGTTARRDSAGNAGREARFIAPGPVAIDSALKRNIPQAMTGSASTMSDSITPEFEAQAMYIIELMQKRSKENAAEEAVPEPPESLLDPSDRAEGYKRYRRWVDGGLDLWKVS